MTPKGKRRLKARCAQPIAYPSQKFKIHLPYLNQLRKTSAKERKRLLTNSSPSQISSIQTICKNLKGGGIFLSKARKKRLRKYKKLIRNLANPQLSSEAKRKIIINQKGGFLSTILASILPVLVSEVARRI